MLKSKLENQFLLDKGYIISSFYTEKEINNLLDFFFKHHPQTPNGFYSTSHVQDIAFRQKMSDKICDISKRAIEKKLKDVVVLGATYMSKQRGKEGMLQAHQDWSIVDERKWASYNLWIPLVDVNQDNGTIQIVPKSHKWEFNYRGVNIPSNYNKLKHKVDDLLIPVNINAGRGLLYNHRLWHASPESFSKTLRLAVVIGIMPQKASMKYYYKEGQNIVEYNCNKTFFLQGNPFEGPKGLKKIRTIYSSQNVLQKWFQKIFITNENVF